MSKIAGYRSPRILRYRIDKGLELYFAKNVCDMKKRNNEALENEGHTCVKYMETYPV